MSVITDTWINLLGYDRDDAAVFRYSEAVGMHPYATEIHSLLDGTIDPAIQAVVCVDKVPSACFVELDPDSPGHVDRLEAIRGAIWNQNLISIVLVAGSGSIQPLSSRRNGTIPSRLYAKNASRQGLFSLSDIASGDLLRRHEDWFEKKARVDQSLLSNLSKAVDQLGKEGVPKEQAQYILGQCLFVSYLEHRAIVGDAYRHRRQVGSLHSLISAQDRNGLRSYISQLKYDFNGDFLSPELAGEAAWGRLSDGALQCLDKFIQRTDMESGQRSFWHYDFRYIPVELISGIYETFLGNDKKLLGAFYTPRHLASFVIDQAFHGRTDITQEIVYDGACGSGILLVTAFRRMLNAMETKVSRTLSFAERSALLTDHIRGSDLNESACRVTAFSLYLSLLENLQPTDIALLCDDQNVKLPELINHILWHGSNKGDFFSDSNTFSATRSATVFLSNPPWAEPNGKVRDLPYEKWASEHRYFLPHRQIAAAFAHKAIDATQVGGRICLILPAKLFLSRSSQQFIEQFLVRCQLQRIVNFADVRLLLFPQAIHPCVVVVADITADAVTRGRPLEFDYWTPKADVSLAFGRLTIHGSDRHRLPIGFVARDNQMLRTYLWGGPQDQVLLHRLSGLGKLDDLVTNGANGASPRWIEGKGFHKKDASRDPIDTRRLRKNPFLPANQVPECPILDAQLLTAFPSEYKTVASMGAHDGQLFSGARVVLPDGADSSTFEPQAFFSESPFSFKSSIGAFRGPDADAPILQFLAVYLRSSLVKYLLLSTSYAMTVERTRVSMTELKQLPFVLPEEHPDPKQAWLLIEKVGKAINRLTSMEPHLAPDAYRHMQPKFDELVNTYFGLNENEQALIKEACEYFIPSVQPTWSGLAQTPLSHRVTETLVEEFTGTIQNELSRIQTSLGGRGTLTVRTVMNHPGLAGPLGICQISLTGTPPLPGSEELTINDANVENALAWLHENSLLPLAAGEAFSLASDFLFFSGDAMFLVKPLITRFWLKSQALRDALRVVHAARHANLAQSQ